MTKNKVYTIIDIGKQQSFIKKNKIDSYKSLLLGTFLFLAFSILIYQRSDGITTRFIIEMIFPILFYSFVFIYRDLFAVGKSVSRVINKVELLPLGIKIHTISYSIFAIKYYQHSHFVQNENVKLRLGDFYIKYKEFKGKTLLFNILDKDYYLFPDFFDDELKEQLLALSK